MRGRRRGEASRAGRVPNLKRESGLAPFARRVRSAGRSGARGRAGEGWRRRGAGSRATRVPRNELGVRWVLGVWRSGGEKRSRGVPRGSGKWPCDPPWEDSACDDDRRAMRGLRRGVWRGTDEGGRMGGGLMCAPSLASSAMTKDGGAGASVRRERGADANNDSATGIARLFETRAG